MNNVCLPHPLLFLLSPSLIPRSLGFCRLLMSLKETNRAAFIALLQHDLEGLLPLVYTPVIAQACMQWGTLIPRPLGLYVTPEDDPMDLIKRWPSQEVRADT
jgi:hypothetical protein